MGKRRWSVALAALLALFLCAGCAGGQGAGGGSSVPGSPEGTPAEEDRIELTEEHKAVYADLLWPLAENGELLNDWDNGPDPLYDRGGLAQQLEVVDAVLEGDTMTLTAEVYGFVAIDQKTEEEYPRGDGYTIVGAYTVQSALDDPHYPFILLGTSTVKLRGTAAGQEFLSCRWVPLEKPGHTYLEARTKAVQAQLDASEKLDLSKYDYRMVSYIYQVIQSQRMIGSPEEITRWDLENLCTQLDVIYETPTDPVTGEFLFDPSPLDASLVRLIPTLRSFIAHEPLTDYSVFEEMDLDLLDLYLWSEEKPVDLSTLRVGHTKRLYLGGINQDITLDLSHSKVDALEFHSWGAGVSEFRGCGGITELVVHNTRTDTTLINKDIFPDLKVLRMDFMSEYPRFRDLSQLATFGEDVQIDLTLSYQACNNKTVASLDGVRLNRLTLDPKNGQWPLDEPDPSLVDRVRAQQVEWLDPNNY